MRIMGARGADVIRLAVDVLGAATRSCLVLNQSLEAALTRRLMKRESKQLVQVKHLLSMPNCWPSYAKIVREYRLQGHLSAKDATKFTQSLHQHPHSRKSATVGSQSMLD